MRRYCLPVVLMLIGAMGVLPGCQSLSSRLMTSSQPDQEFALSTTDAVMAEAMAHFSMGALLEGILDSGALTNYLQAVELEPECEILYVQVAAQHIKRDEHDQAEAVMEEACRRNPKSFDAHLYLAKVCLELNKLDKAEDACHQAIKLAPRDPEGYIHLASVYDKKQDPDHVLSTLEEALGKVDEKLTLYRWLGDLHAKRIGMTPDKTSRHLEQAIDYYELASQEPHDALSIPYLHRLGDLYILDQDIAEAIRCFNEIAIHYPNDIQVQKKLVLCYLAINDKENAVKLLKSISGREPDNGEVHYYLGELYEAMGDMTNAICSYTSACEASPVNQLPYVKLALLYSKTDPEKASQTLKAGLKQIPENTEMLTLLARLYIMNRQNQEAMNTFEQIHEIFLKRGKSFLTSDFFLSFGWAAQQSKLPEKAASLFQQALELDPTSFEPYRLLASLYLSQNRKEDAIQLMEKATRALPDNPHTYYYLGLLNNDMGHFRESVKAFSKVEELAVRFSELILGSSFFYNYAAACEHEGRFKQAEYLLQKSILLDPENADAFNYLAYMWAEKGINLDQALEYITHALDFDPENGAYIDTLGWIYYKQNKFILALEHIQSALYFIPDDPTIAEHLGDILAAIHQEKNAIAWWTYSYNIHPDNQTLKEKLKQWGVDAEKLRRETKPEMEPVVSP